MRSKKITKKYKETTGDDLRIDLVFNIDDPTIDETYRGNKTGFLRFLKSLKENYRTRPHIGEILVKGPKGTVEIEPNVFASGVRFEEI